MVEKDRSIIVKKTYLLKMLPPLYQTNLENQLSESQLLFLNLLINVLQDIKEVSLEKIANALPVPILFESRRKKIQRFLSLPILDIEKIWFPIVKSWLTQNFAENQRIYLVIDRTKWQRKKLMMISLVYDQRAIPIYWEFLPRMGNSNFEEQSKIFSQILGLFHKYQTVVLGDREFCSVKLANWLREKEVKFCLRLKKSEFIENEDEIWHFLDSLGLKPGVSLFLQNIKVTKSQKIQGFNLAAKCQRTLKGWSYDPTQDYLKQIEFAANYRLQNEPDNLNWRYTLVLSQVLQRQVPELIQNLTELTKYDSKNPYIWLYLAFIYLYDFQPVQAEQKLAITEQLQPDIPELKTLKKVTNIMKFLPLIHFYNMRSFIDKEWLLGLLVASLVLWLMFLGNVPLRDWDEGTYAIVAREIYRTGNWLYPTLQGEQFLLKPPLMQWLIALCYHIGGVEEFTTRFPGAMLTALGVPLLYLVGRLVFQESLPALFAALVYLTMLPVVRHGRLAMLDGMTISFFLLLLFCLLQARHHRKYALGVGFCLGLITLTKGMLVLVLGGIAGLFLIFNRQLVLLKNPYLWIGMLLGNMPAIAWYIAQWQHYGDIFLQVHFQAQALDRLGQAVEGNTGPPWYYLIEIIKYSFPWLLFLPGGLYLSWQKRHTTWGCLILIGTIVYLGIISFMRTKLPWYIMPVYPFLALAIGAKLSKIWQQDKFKGKFLTVFFALLSIASLGGCVYFFIADPQPILIVMSIILAISMGVTSWLAKQSNRYFIPALFSGIYLVLALLMSSQSWIWELNEAFPVKPVAALIRANVPAGTQIYTSFAYSRPSLDFYSDCKVIAAPMPVLQQMLGNKSYLLLDKETLEQINLSNNKIAGEAQGFTLILISVNPIS